MAAHAASLMEAWAIEVGLGPTCVVWTGCCSVATGYSERIINGENKCSDLFDSEESEGVINLCDISFQINEDRVDSDSDDVIIIE